MSIRQGNNLIAGTPDVTGKADTDLSNLTSTGKSTGAKLSMPSDNWIDLPIPAQLTPLTAPANGYYCSRSNGQLYISIYNPLSSAAENEMMSTWLPINGSALYLPVKKGQQVKFGYSTAPQYFRFIYAEGEI